MPLRFTARQKRWQLLNPAGAGCAELAGGFTEEVFWDVHGDGRLLR
ncbi:MAG TPA: hypothetical protein PKV20_20370 [Anaerolineae bacterium]|nr:hypothetical protein [Anaerolineae bacterium]